MKYKPCPNCGKKGRYWTENCFLPNKTSKCKCCDMEFEKTINKGEQVDQGDIPVFL